jgi:hypothetical protein
MFSTKTLYHWKESIAKRFSFLSKPQRGLLAVFSAGVTLARCCTLARVAEALWWLGKPDSGERRLQRFLANPRIDWQEGCRCLARWVLGNLISARRLVVLLIDETTRAEHLKVMAVSLAYHGRAIPLAWWCYHQDHYPMRQLKLIKTLLDWVAPAIPADCTVLVQTDRGLSNSPGLLRMIEQRGWSYLVRVQRALHLRHPDGQEIRFGELIRRPGQQWSGPVRAFKSAGWIDCWALAHWGKGHKEPWLLLSNYRPAQAGWYGWRMWEELAFRDFKSMGWQWQKSRVWEPEHANRLWLVLALTYAWVLSLGTQGAYLQRVRPELTRGKKLRLSLFRLGLRLLSRAKELFGAVIRAFDLLLISVLPPYEKTVVQ